ncbi:MAG: hypothetical protein CMM01_07480 [Rhodopirellula sp.]|nr:hypothetical protein [Rhodopirellula sp.]OUX51713.1 MAG: hypothetical protein CBE43_02685 [Rhodopirellula sp. TMED283]
MHIRWIVNCSSAASLFGWQGIGFDFFFENYKLAVWFCHRKVLNLLVATSKPKHFCALVLWCSVQLLILND